MTINSNISSLISQQFLNKSTRGFSTAVDRLSSGLRINSAADDSAGLAISNRFQAQARAFDVFSRNANDAISYMQVAEGALGEISNNLLRMDEIRVQASNGILSNTDRQRLDLEYQQLKDQNSDIVANTQYNGINVFGAGRTTFSTQFGKDSVSFDLAGGISFNGQTARGALSDIFNAAGVGAVAASLTNLPPGRVSVIGTPAPGSYTVDVNQLARGFIYRDTVGAGPFGVDGVAGGVTDSNPGVANYVSGGSGVYNITTSFDSYVYSDTGLGGRTFGFGGLNANQAAANSNPAVATANAPAANEGTYRVTVNQSAAAFTGRSSNTTGGNAYGSNDVDGLGLNGAQPTTNTFAANYGGVNFTVDLANGAYSRDDFIAAFNSAATNAGAGVSANLVGNRIVYTGTVKGAGNDLTVTNTSTGTGIFAGTNDNSGDVFEVAQVVQASQNATGSVQRFDSAGNSVATTAFSDADGNNITVDGLSFNALTAGTTDIVQRSSSDNVFRLTYGDGVTTTFSTPSGEYSAADYVSAFNAAQVAQFGAGNERFTASFDGNNITYTGSEKGVDKTMSIESIGDDLFNSPNNAFDSQDDSREFETTTVSRLGGYSGTVDNGGGPVAYYDADGINIAAGGIVFNYAGDGSTQLTVAGGVTGSINNFRVDIGDGTSFTFGPAGGLDSFTLNDYVNSFNAASSANGNRYTASIQGGDVVYTSNITGATASSLSITDLSGDNPAFSTANAAVDQTGRDSSVTVNGVTSTQATNTFSSPSLTFDILAVGANTNITFTAAIPGAGLNTAFGDVSTLSNAREEADLIRASMDAITGLRAKFGANISRLDSIVEQSKIAGENYYAAMGRIIDADFAFETARLTRNQILSQSAAASLSIANQNGNQILSLIGTGL